MVAPIDAKSTFMVEGEQITLRLNFRSIALAEAEGIDLLSGKEIPPLKVAVLVRCLAVEDHPEMTNDEALAIVMRGKAGVAKALPELFAKFGAKPSVPGNAKPKARAKA